MMRGSIISRKSLVNKGSNGMSAPTAEVKYRIATAGTRRTESKFEKTVEKIALAVLPPENVENTTADETVVGKIDKR
jgi:hypothetical protein